MKIEVRRGNRADRIVAIRMMRDFLASIGGAVGPIAIDFDAARAECLYLHHVERDDALALMALTASDACGLLLAQYVEHPFGAGRIARETMWWIDPSARNIGAGRMMLLEYERWAMEQSCSHVAMAALDARASEILSRAGYSVVETMLAKRI